MIVLLAQLIAFIRQSDPTQVLDHNGFDKCAVGLFAKSIHYIGDVDYLYEEIVQHSADLAEDENDNVELEFLWDISSPQVMDGMGLHTMGKMVEWIADKYPTL